jgi:lysophospholipase L1-like esterase
MAGVTTQSIGPATPVTGSPISVGGTYVIAVPASWNGFLPLFQVFGLSAGTLKVKRFTLIGTSMTWVSEFSVAFGTGLQTFHGFGADFPTFPVNAGDYLGFYFATGHVAYNAVPNNSTPYYVATGDITTSFTVGALGTALELEIAFSVEEYPPDPAIVVADVESAVVGRECDIYHDNLLACDVDDFRFSYAAPGIPNAGLPPGPAMLAECLRWTPSAAQAATPATVTLYDSKTLTPIKSATFNLQAAAANAKSGVTQQVLGLGDSLTAYAFQFLQCRLIAAGDVMGVNFLGSRTTTLINAASLTASTAVAALGTAGGVTIANEGRPGWASFDYVSGSTRIAWVFTVSGVSVSPVGVDPFFPSAYTNNGSTFAVRDVNISGGSGTITCEKTAGSNAPTASGTLTQTTGPGDATISFSSFTAGALNPLWIGGSVNFAGYRAARGIALPNWVVLALGTNDVFTATTDAAATTTAANVVANLATLIASIHADSAAIKIAVATCIPPGASEDGFALQYGFQQFRARYKRNALLLSKAIVQAFAGQQASGVWLLPHHTAIDTVNNWQLAPPANINALNTAQIARQTAGVHPGPIGAGQMGEKQWALMKNV